MTDRLKGLSIFLIGMMGTGKTTVGKTLARQLGYRFFDTDVLIERVSNQSIKKIFATQREEGFRDLETQVLSEVCACTRSVIATGGGIILRQKNWSYLHHGLIIWLDAPVELLRQRVAQDTMQERPLAADLAALLEKRRSLYAEADLHISLNAVETPEQIAGRIIEEIPTILQPIHTVSAGDS